MANEYLESEYLAEHNRRFARTAASEQDYHRQRPSRKELDEVFRLETERAIGNDWVVRHQNRLFQVTRQSRYAPARSKVVVCEWEDGKVEIRYGGKRLCHEEIAVRPAVEATSASAADATAGQPPMAKRLSTNPAEKEDSTVKNELWKWRNGGSRRMEKWKTKSRCPTFPPPRIRFLPEVCQGSGRAPRAALRVKE